MEKENVEQSPAGADVTANEDGIADKAFENPFDFSARKKWRITILLAAMTFTATFASSVFSPTISATAQEFHVSETVMLLGVSFYVLGFALGPILWGPLSELVGRKWPLFGGYALFAIMQIPTALSPTLTGVLLSRLLAGCFGGAPIVIVSAAYADFWEPAGRGVATAVYSVATYSGPTLGPILGSLLTETQLGWRWTAWLTLIMACAIGPPAFFLVPETYAPVLKARLARNVESRSKRNQLQDFVSKFMMKPAQMLVSEIMLDVMTIYISLSYGILYLTFYAVPYSYMHERGWDPRIATLPFIGILIGVLASCLFIAVYSQKYYLPRLKARGKVLPEDRLPPIMVGAACLPIGLFWFAWTASPQVSWVPQVLSGIFIGAGIMLIFSGGIVFIVDIYLAGSASALTLNTFVRSFVAAGLPLAAPKMYKTLGVAWATSLLGFLCLALMPAPFLFYKYGERLRRKSKFAPTP